MEEEVDSGSEQQPVIVRRRGKRLRKRKYRRGSTYGQQTEVRDPLEPTVTQVSQIENGSRRPSLVFIKICIKIYNSNILYFYIFILMYMKREYRIERKDKKNYFLNTKPRNRVHINIDNVDDSISSKKTPLHTMDHTMPPSFLTPDILKYLCRELDRDKVEAEFSIKVNMLRSLNLLNVSLNIN